MANPFSGDPTVDTTQFGATGTPGYNGTPPQVVPPTAPPPSTLAMNTPGPQAIAPGDIGSVFTPSFQKDYMKSTAAEAKSKADRLLIDHPDWTVINDGKPDVQVMKPQAQPGKGGNPALAAQLKSALDKMSPGDTGYDEIKQQYDAAQGTAGTVKMVPDLEATATMRDALRLAAEAKTAGVGVGGGGLVGGSSAAGRSYLATEGDKTKEVARQLADFENRASRLYSLQDSEQGYAMKADDQNTQNRKAMSQGTALPGLTGYYINKRPGDTLSQILAPSLPDYVSPDYRLNSAVGLPGGEGFTDPQYDQNGAPLYAYGTPPPEWHAQFEHEWENGSGPMSKWPSVGKNAIVPPWVRGYGNAQSV